MQKLCIIILAAVVAASSLNAETVSMEDAAAKASVLNNEVIKAGTAAEKAKEDIPDIITLKNSTLSLQGGYGVYSDTSSGSSGTIQTEDALSGSAVLSLPVISQLSLGGSFAAQASGKLSGKLSLTLSPFAESPETYTAEKTYKTALVTLKYLKQKTYYAAENAVLTVILADRERLFAQDTYELEAKKLDLYQKQLALDAVTFQEVQDQLATVTAAAKDLYNKETSYLSAWKTLQLLFTANDGEIAVQNVSFDELASLIDQRKARLASFENEHPSSQSLEILNTELEALKAQLAATPVWRPSLSANASVSLPSPSVSVGVSLTFSPSQIKTDDRKDLEDSISEKIMDIKTETFALEIQKKMLLKNIAIAEQALASAKLSWKKADLALKETELLHSQGKRTDLELEQERLNLRSAEIQSFSSASALYAALSEYLMLFVK